MNYYYLAASLPMLSLDEPPRMTSEAFAALCAEHLNRPDREALAALDDPGLSCGHAFVTAWRRIDTQLRNAVARARARRRHADAGSFLREHEGFEPYVEKAVENAFGAPTPLARERALDRCRWDLLDGLAGTNEFSSAAVLAYREKLRLAERSAGHDEDRGRDKVDALISRGEAE